MHKQVKPPNRFRHMLKRKEIFMEDFLANKNFGSMLSRKSPSAHAWISGNADYPQLNGLARFYETPMGGILVSVEVYGIPDTSPSGFHGMHIHEVGDCTLPFDKTGGHFNPTGAPHPEHAGDLLPLLSNNGYAYETFYDTKFTIADIIGKSLIIHSMRDDFTSQPSGDSGVKIGCGVIRR